MSTNSSIQERYISAAFQMMVSIDLMTILHNHDGIVTRSGRGLGLHYAIFLSQDKQIT